MTVSELTMKFLMTWFWSPRIFRTSAGLAQAGCGAAEHVVQVLRAARQAGAELGDDQAEPLAVRAGA